jgi:putative lipoprotein
MTYDQNINPAFPLSIVLPVDMKKIFQPDRSDFNILHSHNLAPRCLFSHQIKILTSCFLLFLLTACATAPANHREDDWFSKDKYAHFLLSGIASAAIAKAAKENGKDNCDAAMIGIGITLTLGAAKESYDKRRKKTLYSSHDMVWNLAGSTIGGLAGANCL